MKFFYVKLLYNDFIFNIKTYFSFNYYYCVVDISIFLFILKCFNIFYKTKDINNTGVT